MSKIDYACVAPIDDAFLTSAQEIATRLDLPLIAVPVAPRQCTETGLLLQCGEELALQLTGPNAPGPVAVDFGSSHMRHRRQSGHNELLGRAAGVGKKPRLGVVDATAGLGRDSFVLADLGCEVLLCERNTLIQSLLQDGLRRAGLGDLWLQEVASRMSLWCGDSTGAPQLAQGEWDVIYLDPMFPAREKSAAVKKEMALFQYLLSDDAQDQGALLDWALMQDVARVVVKRPPKAEHLGDKKPSHSIKGKAVRYDVYVLRALA
ncbi:class I SAM-dependent methyltransferase [Halioglobus maricola]|uniref:class I SAM-dependent methyltransferase n=1 Tax=Halioglobus maricola TaxID=2601894 RepID=UPI001F0EACA3|nr:class I SAM-dependent methyltransferase [Halioglobus maricola]